VESTGGKGPFGRYKCKCEDNSVGDKKRKRGGIRRGFIWLRLKMSGCFERCNIEQGGEVLGSA
jgi:hypothetical protein